MATLPCTDVVVLGAGAAGLFSAALLAERGLSVILLERLRNPGKKILISGGGRCNFTNRQVTAKNYHAENPHFMKSALSRFLPEDFIALVEAKNIAYHEKKLGQLFCDRSAQDILNLLVERVTTAGAEIITNCEVRMVTKTNDKFRITTNSENYSGKNIIVATGGLAVPKISTDIGFKIARDFGIAVNEPRPALVPLGLKSEDLAWTADLSGVSFLANVSCGSVKFCDDVLFTHFGLSGPGILQISSVWDENLPVHVDFFPKCDADFLIEKKRSGSKAFVENILATLLSERLARALTLRFNLLGAIDQKLDQDLRRFGAALKKWEFVPQKTLGFEKAEVMRGGICLDEISSKTFESKKVPGLYFIGEVLDVTGWLGGYNFHWAWASAAAAAESVE